LAGRTWRRKGLDEAGVEHGGLLSVAGLVCREVNTFDCLSPGPEDSNCEVTNASRETPSSGSKQQLQNSVASNFRERRIRSVPLGVRHSHSFNVLSITHSGRHTNVDMFNGSLQSA
jgi:hypothetical protein